MSEGRKWFFDFVCSKSHRKTTSLEDFLTGRWPHRKTISQEGDLNKKMTLWEYKVKVRPQGKTTTEEGNLTGRWISKSVTELGPAQPQLVLFIIKRFSLYFIGDNSCDRKDKAIILFAWQLVNMKIYIDTTFDWFGYPQYFFCFCYCYYFSNIIKNWKNMIII